MVIFHSYVNVYQRVLEKTSTPWESPLPCLITGGYPQKPAVCLENQTVVFGVSILQTKPRLSVFWAWSIVMVKLGTGIIPYYTCIWQITLFFQPSFHPWKRWYFCVLCVGGTSHCTVNNGPRKASKTITYQLLDVAGDPNLLIAIQLGDPVKQQMKTS